MWADYNNIFIVSQILYRYTYKQQGQECDMKKILTSVFILACCMGGAMGNYCSKLGNNFPPSNMSVYDPNGTCLANSTRCKNGCKGTYTVDSCSNVNYAIRATEDFTYTHALDPETNYTTEYIKECLCQINDASYTAVCDENYYGQYNNCSYDKHSCDNCSTSCTECPDSQMTSALGSTNINACKCPVNTYRDTNANGKYYCQGCPVGSTTKTTTNETGTGATKLNDCKCPADQYMGKNDNGKDACLSCPTDAKSAVGSDDIDDCKCPQGYYMKADKKGCALCPEYIDTKAPGYNEDDPDNSADSAKFRTTTTSSGAKSIQECFIPQGIEFCDEKGCGKYTDNAGHN